MQYYVLTKNNILIGIVLENPYSWNLSDISIHEFEGNIPDLNSFVWDSNIDNLVQSSDIYTKVGFLNLFTLEERINIRASGDPIINDFLNMLDVAEYISTKDPNTIAALQYLVLKNILTSERIYTILN